MILSVAGMALTLMPTLCRARAPQCIAVCSGRSSSPESHSTQTGKGIFPMKCRKLWKEPRLLKMCDVCYDSSSYPLLIHGLTFVFFFNFAGEESLQTRRGPRYFGQFCVHDTGKTWFLQNSPFCDSSARYSHADGLLSPVHYCLLEVFLVLVDAIL